MTTPVCRSCGSSSIIPDAVVNDHNSTTAPFPLGVTVKLAQPQPVDALGIATRTSVTVPLRAQVCGDCGATDLYAADPATLWAAYRG